MTVFAAHLNTPRNSVLAEHTSIKFNIGGSD